MDSEPPVIPAYSVRHSRRARRMRIRVLLDGTVEVVLPWRASTRAVPAFVKENAAWIASQQNRFAAARIRANASLFETSRTVALDGLPRAVQILPAGARLEAALVDGTFRVAAPDDASARRVLEAWYRAAARSDLALRVEAFSRTMGVTSSALRIGSQRTRWGSCSTRGTLSFNWRLMMAPPEVRDYVVVHELCHLTHMNHSLAFWALLEQHCPDYRRWKRWLRELGPGLVM